MPRTHFALRLTPDSPFVDLEDWIVRAPAQVEAAAENNFNEFRGTQISLTLDDLDGEFGVSGGQYYLQGGEEISVWIGPPAPIISGNIAGNGSWLFWSGTVDASSINKPVDSKLLTIRVLQHGSLLNTIEAGLPDWQVVNGELVLDESVRHRWKGVADNWQRVRDHEDNNTYHNEIADEHAQVYYTPSALNALTDPLYKAKFATKVHHFHTAAPDVGGVEYPFNNVDGNPPRWTGQFKPHYRPNFDLPNPHDWEDQLAGVTQDSGSYLQNSEAVLPFRRQAIPDIIAELIAQFNLTAKFPLRFDPDTDCVIVSPQIEQQIELLERQPNVDFIDIRLIPGTTIVTPRVYVIVNYLPDEGSPAGAVSIYNIENETELNTLVDHYILPQEYRDNFCWPTHQRGLRFATDPNSSGSQTTAYAYTMRFDTSVPGLARFTALWFAIPNQQLSHNGPRTHTVIESAGDYEDDPDGFVVNRRAQFQSTTFTVRTGGVPHPPEADPQSSLEYGGRSYTSRQGGLTVNGVLFNRVAVDAENIKIAALLAELAKLTFSRVFVTPDRRVKFISRQLPASTTHTIAADSLVGEPIGTRRTLDEVQIPSFGSGLVLAENYKQAARVWYQDQVKGQTSFGTELIVPAEDLAAPPCPHDALVPPPKVFPEPDGANAVKYGNRYCLDRITLDTENTLFTLEASQPLI